MCFASRTHEESRVCWRLHSKISWCWCGSFPLSSLLNAWAKTWGVQRVSCPVPACVCGCVCVLERGLALESCITVVMSRLTASLIPQQHPALTRPLNKAFDPPAAEKVTACLWLPCLSVCIHGQEPSCHSSLTPLTPPRPPSFWRGIPGTFHFLSIPQLLNFAPTSFQLRSLSLLLFAVWPLPSNSVFLLEMSDPQKKKKKSSPCFPFLTPSDPPSIHLFVSSR